MNARADRFPLFDSLRAIAALSVLGAHAAVFSGAESEGRGVAPYAARLDVGLTVFFLISGFLLFRPFVRARMAGEDAPATGAYAWRRFLRIVPAYWVALTVIAALGAAPGVLTADGIPTFYGFGQIYWTEKIGAGIPQAWTLCVEVTFYAFLPLYAASIRRIGRRDSEEARLRTEVIGVAALFVFSLVWKTVVLGAGDLDHVKITPALIALPGYLDQFAVGMMLAVVSVGWPRNGATPAPLRLIERYPAACWLVAGVAFWTVSTQIGLEGKFLAAMSAPQYLARHMLYMIVALGLLLPAAFGDPERGLVRRFLSNRVLLYLGLISYGIYLYNLFALTKLEDWGLADLDIHPYVAWGGAGIALSVAMASASYYLIERPALSLKGLVGKPPSPPDEALVERAPGAPPDVAPAATGAP